MSKKPRLFYYEIALDAWIPVPEKTNEMVNTDLFESEEERLEIEFKCVYMTDEEFDNLMEG